MLKQILTDKIQLKNEIYLIVKKIAANKKQEKK